MTVEGSQVEAPQSDGGEVPTGVSASELPGFFGRIETALLRLEDAWARGALSDALEEPETVVSLGPAVVGAYGRLQAMGARPSSAFRRAALHQVLVPLKELLSPPDAWFEGRWIDPPPQVSPGEPGAAPAGEPSSETPLSVPERLALAREILSRSPRHLPAVRVQGPSSVLEMTLAQVAAVRAWGVGVRLPEGDGETRVATHTLRAAQSGLAKDLGDLAAVEGWLQARPDWNGEAQVVPDLAGRRYERLMLDILNEPGEVATRARLEEDFLEKTDLRVRLPTLQRRRGARVQVTRTTRREYLSEKMMRIPRVEEFVILTPRTLAEAVASADPPLFDAAGLKAFWDSLVYKPTTVDDLAMRLRQIFSRAIARAQDDPRGPMAAVPAPVRDLVQAYVMAEAHRSTVALRAREARDGRRPSRPRAAYRGRGRRPGDAPEGS